MPIIQLKSSDIFHFYKPSRCERRLYLMEFPPEQFETAHLSHLKEADQQLERHFLKGLQDFKDLSKGPNVSRLRDSMKAWMDKKPVLYKPLFSYTYAWQGQDFELMLEPDFLVWDDEGYCLRLCRNARKINRENHADLILMAQYQGWLYAQIFGEAPPHLEIYNNSGRLLEIKPAEPEFIENQVQQFLALKSSPELPYSPISWTKCQSCAFREYCWDKAEEIQDIALVPMLEARLILALREAGAKTVNDFLALFPEERLAEFIWHEGQNPRKIGAEKAHNMRQMAQVVLTGRPHLLQDPQLPQTAYWAMFDLEGVPAQPGHSERVYLWGLSLMGPDGEDNLQTLAPHLSRKADQTAWMEFLAKAGKIFETHGDIPFIHWGSFEVQSLKLYSQRYGDPQGIARRVKKNLLDFWALLKASVLIPLPSYSLKVIEQYVGFDRPDKETGGYWSVVSYLKSTSTRNQSKQLRLQQELLDYNHADLVAMWHVVEWFQAFMRETENQKFSES
jgi:predicted RecB family nuclease